MTQAHDIRHNLLGPDAVLQIRPSTDKVLLDCTRTDGGGKTTGALAYIQERRATEAVEHLRGV